MLATRYDGDMPMPFGLADLNWSRTRKPRLREVWRFYLVGLIADAAAIALVHRAFPDVTWFFVLWCGLVFGAAASVIPGALWQLADPSRRPATSGWMLLMSLVAGVVFTLISAFYLCPQLISDEKALHDVRAIGARDISRVEMQRRGSSLALERGAALQALLAQLREATLLYPSHESFENEGTLTFFDADGHTLAFAAEIPARHADDLALRGGGIAHVLVPGARHLLDAPVRAAASR